MSVIPGAAFVPPGPPVALPQTEAATQQSWKEGAILPSRTGGTYIMDPITAKEHNIQHVPTAELMEPSLLERVGHNFKTVFVTLPQAVAEGLRGDPNYNFAKHLLVAKIPYYLGGIVLTGSFMAAGGNRLPALKIGAGVLSYYLGTAVVEKAVNKIVQWRYGFNPAMKYRRENGTVDTVFGSLDFFRSDLLGKRHYEKIRQKMGIPAYVADVREACNEQIRRILVASTAVKVILGGVAAAFGAGYFARSDGWAALLNGRNGIRQRLFEQNGGSLWNRLARTGQYIGTLLKVPLGEKLLLKAPAPVALRVALGTGFALVALSLVELLTLLKHKNYEPTPVKASDWRHDILEGAGNPQLITHGGVFRQILDTREVTLSSPTGGRPR